MKFSFKLNQNCSSDSRKLHKNLFLNDAATFYGLNNDDDNESHGNYPYIDEYESDYEEKIEKKSQYYKLNDFSMPLTETIADFVEELSEEKFILNDLSFLFEISRKRAISPYVMIVALIYLNRLKTKTVYAQKVEAWSSYSSSCLISSYFNRNSSKSSNSLSNTELCLVSILLASKYLVDEGEIDEFNNSEWATAAELSVKKINSLEKDFLQKMEWNLFVSSNDFWDFTNDLTEKITRKKVKVNGQCTYSDLDCLFEANGFSLGKWLKCLEFLYKVTLVCSSTLVYVLMSSLFVSSCVFTLKIQLLNQLNLMNKFNDASLIGETSTYIKSNNETQPQVQVSSGETLDYLVALDQKPIHNGNEKVSNLSVHKCLSNDEFRLDLKDGFDMDNNYKNRPPRFKTNYLGQFKSIRILNSYQKNLFQILV